MTSLITSDEQAFDAGIGRWAGYTEFGADPFAATRVTSPTPHAGSGVLKLTGLGQWKTSGYPFQSGVQGHVYFGGGFEELTVTPGDYVRFSYWVRQDPGNEDTAGTFVQCQLFNRDPTTGNSYRMFIRTTNNTYWGSGGPLSTTGWTKVEIDMVLPYSRIDVQFDWGGEKMVSGSPVAVTTPVTAYISDVALEAVPFTWVPPTNGSTSRDADGITVEWDLPSGQVAPVATSGGFRLIDWTGGGDTDHAYPTLPPIDILVERSVTGSGSWGGAASVGQTGALLLDDGTAMGALDPDTSYTYRVRAKLINYPWSLSNFASDWLLIVAPPFSVGGWGVGMVRMGAN